MHSETDEQGLSIFSALGSLRYLKAYSKTLSSLPIMLIYQQFVVGDVAVYLHGLVCDISADVLNLFPRHAKLSSIMSVGRHGVTTLLHI